MPARQCNATPESKPIQPVFDPPERHTLPLVAALKDDPRNVIAPCVYVVRDGGAVFYVGSTTRAIPTRLKQHIKTGSALGAIIVSNWPQAANWQVEIVDPEQLAGGPYHDHYAAERAIRHNLKPSLNTFDNDPSPLPEQYKSGGAAVPKTYRRALPGLIESLDFLANSGAQRAANGAQNQPKSHTPARLFSGRFRRLWLRFSRANRNDFDRADQGGDQGRGVQS